MAAPQNFEECQLTTTPPRFNDEYYGWWKTSMHDFILVEDLELYDVIENDLFVPIRAVKVGDVAS